MICLTVPQQQVPTLQTAQSGAIESELSQMVGALSSSPPAEAYQQPRYILVHRDAAMAITENMTMEIHFKIVCTSELGGNRHQYAIGCGKLHMNVDGGHQAI